MKKSSVLIALVVALFVAGNAAAQMGGGGMMGGTMGQNNPGSWNQGNGPGLQTIGKGYGMGGAGRMMSWLSQGTINRGYLDVLVPITTPEEAIAAIDAFIAAAGSTLEVSELWEYAAVYKAELSDANGQKAFDILADKLTGAVMPDMGMSMMLNASWGKALQKTPTFARKLLLTPESATAAAQAFLDKNTGVLDYTLATPEVYPGFYKFHTTDGSGNPGIDIMVNGYNGRIWMDTQRGAPIALIPLAP